MVRLVTLVLLLLVTEAVRADVEAAGWTVGVGCESSGSFGTSLFTATTSGGFNGGGSCARVATGFTKLSYSTVTGGALHAADRFALHTGDVMILPATLSTEQQPIFTVRPGCPVNDFTLNWIFVQWDSGARNVNANYVFGGATYDTTTGIVVTGQYDINGNPYYLNPVPMPGGCTNGVYTALGPSSDTAGNVYFSPTGAGVFKTAPGHATFFFERAAASPATTLNSRVAPGVAFDSRQATSNRNVEVTTDAAGTTWTIRPYLDPETGTIDTTYTDTITVTATNAPQNGMLRGTVTRTGAGAGAGKIACIVNTDFDTRVICSGESPTPSDSHYPYTITFVAVGSCPANFVRVPKNYAVESYRDFCVAKYEMKDDGSSNAVSQSAGLPWLVDRPTAISECQALGPGYDLIANAQWQAVARNIEDAYSAGGYLNWSNGSQSGTNYLNEGHADAVPAAVLAASTDNDPCNGTGQASCADNTNAHFLQKRTHQLSNGAVLWDFGGNYWEWVKDDALTVQGVDGSTYQETWGTGLRKLWGPRGSYSNRTATPFGGLGVYFFTGVTGTILRGGGHPTGAGSGVFYARVGYAPSTLEGFRCSYFPVTDAIAPSVRLTTLDAGQRIKGSSTYTLQWTATDLAFGVSAITIDYDCGGGWTNILTSGANSGSTVWSTPGLDTAACQLRVTATDAAGNATVKTSALPFTIDSTAPTLTGGFFVVNGGASTTMNNNVTVSLRGADALSPVSHFCLKSNDNTPPTIGASCWVPVNASLPGLPLSGTLQLSNYYFRLGFISGTYTVYGWVRDEVGNISSLSAAGAGTNGLDKATITYSVDPPPLIVNAISATNDSPSNPPTAPDVTFGAGGDVYVKWNATSTIGLIASPISLSYTLDDVTYTPIVSGIANAQGAGCTVGGSHTGCYRWAGGAPGTSYFRVRVAAQDTQGLISYGSTQPLNVATTFRLLAGNPETGLGATASAAVFFNDTAIASASDLGNFVVLPNGTVYFRDVNRGILKVDPATGTQSLFIPVTGTSSGDGGPATSATLRRAMRLALDYQNRLLVFDHLRIRRVDLASGIISTFIGGGASTADGVTPSQVSIATFSNTMDTRSRMPFFALPNGDFYFYSDNVSLAQLQSGFRIRVYRASTGLVTSITPSGTGFFNFPAQALGPCQLSSFAVEFDPVSSAVGFTMMTAIGFGGTVGCDGLAAGRVNLNTATAVSQTPFPPRSSSVNDNSAYSFQGRDGKIYTVYHLNGEIRRYDALTNAWTTLLGGGTGNCVDTTLAASCPNRVTDAFVDHTGQVFFVDAGRIRAIDASARVVTLMGQPFFFGDGGDPLSARFGFINGIDQRSSGAIVVLDRDELRFREFTPGGTIATLAGNGANGTPDKVSAASAQGIAITGFGPYWDDFALDPANGDVYYNRGTGLLGRLDRATGRWTDLVGGGATHYTVADGSLGSAVHNNQYPMRVVGFDGTNVLAQLSNYNGTTISDAMLKLYAITDGKQSPLAGVTGVAGAFFTPGVVLGTAAAVPHGYNSPVDGLWDATGNRWLLFRSGTAEVRTLTPGGNLDTLVTLTTTPVSFTYRRSGPNEYVYYCNTLGRLRKHDMTTDSPLSWPVSTMACAGRTLVFDAGNGSIVFPYTQNGLYGVAEYLSP